MAQSIFIPSTYLWTGTAQTFESYVKIYAGTPEVPSSSPIRMQLTRNGSYDSDVLDLSYELDAQAVDLTILTKSDPLTLTLGGGHDTIRLSGTSTTDLATPAYGALHGGAGTDTLRAGYADLSKMSLTGLEKLAWTGGTVTATVAQLESFSTIYNGVATGPVSLMTADGGLLDLSFELGSQAATVYAGTSAGNTVVLGSGADTFWGWTGNDSATGGGGNDKLYGDAGNDRLDGGSGDDRMEGGTGNDTYVVSGLDTLVEQYGQGVDSVQSAGSFTLGANLENLALTGSLAVNGVGNSLANGLTGNGMANTLRGLSGNDSLSGGSGADSLLGGTGDDLLSGGSEADTFYFEFGRDTVLDFTDNLDTLAFDDALWGGGSLTASQILAWAHPEGTSAVFDFGYGDVLTVRGVRALSTLVDDLAYF